MKEKPDVILVYGDTNTTLAGAVVAAKLKIPLAHIEAGMRSLPKNSPEEINRVLTDHVSDLLFCPSMSAVANLKKENVTNSVYFTGDVMYDLYLKMEKHFKYNLFNKLGFKDDKFILFTLHRDFNVDDKIKLKKILSEINKISQEINIIFPIHPRTRQRVKDFGLELLIKRLKVVDPLDYLNIMGLVKKCMIVITDSGGLQKETYFAGKSSIVLMPDTAWKELINEKINFLTDENKIYISYKKYADIHIKSNIYGDGNAGEKIVNYIVDSIN